MARIIRLADEARRSQPPHRLSKAVGRGITTQRSNETLALVALVALATTFVGSGTPVLRHDWPPPIHGIGEIIGGITGWDPIGLGSPVGYPSSFMVVFARALVSGIAGPYAAHLAYMLGTWSVIASGADSLASRNGAGSTARVAAIAIALFNPWTYTELVAGHLFVLLAYGATFWLTSEALRRPSPRANVLTVLVLVIAPQIQFLVVDGIALFIVALRSRASRPLIGLGAFGIFLFITIAMARSSLVGIPLTLQWEQGLSATPLDAVFLRGYFTHYSVGTEPLGALAIGATFALAAIGAVVAPQKRVSGTIALLTLSVLAIATGTKGPIAVPFAWLVAHVSEIGLFRELYTLLGFALVGYVALAAYASARFRVAGTLWAVAAFAAPVSWILAPPASWWAIAEHVPVLATPPGERYALLPALQPMMLDGIGSGLDPNLVAGAGDLAPIDEYRLTYPIDAAFGSFLERGDARALASLGVSEILDRPWLTSANGADGALAFPLPPALARPSRPGNQRFVAPLPMLAVSPLPAFGTMLAHVGRGNVQIGDGAQWCAVDPQPGCDARAPTPIAAPRAFVRASDGWVDARLAFLEIPQLAQSYGGALTTSAGAELPVRPGHAVLVRIDGRLADGSGRRIIASGTDGYRWIAIPRNVDTVRCIGRCVVAADLPSIPQLPLEPPSLPARAVAYHAVVPWLVIAHLDPGPRRSLRYDVRFDPSWSAFVDGRALPHVRIDGVVNGWILPAERSHVKVLIVERAAAVTTILECGVTVTFLALLGPTTYRRLRRYASSRAPRANRTSSTSR